MTNLIENRQIRVFISSTFRDMNDEREYLLNYTFPKLRRLAAQRDVTLTELDLRWGITEEESKSGKVVEICLREIDNSIPFFIGIIGNRYGWIPKSEDIHDSPNMNDRYQWVFEDVNSGLSVTEMEMQYGVLRRKEKMNAYFYLKNAKDGNTDVDYPEKLATFKKTIKENRRYPVSEYFSTEDLASKVEHDFICMLDNVFPATGMNPHEIEKTKQHAYIRQLSQCYVKQQEAYQNLDSFIKDGKTNYYTITGDSGIGKSAFLANWIKESIHVQSFYILYYFTNEQSNLRTEHILEYWIEELSHLLGKKYIKQEYSGKELKESLENLINSSPKPVLIFLDDATTFQNSDNWQINTMDWIPSIHGLNKIVFTSSISDFCLTEYRKSSENLTEANYRITPLSKDSIQEITIQYLKNYGKSLQKHQIAKICDFKFSSNARILMTLLDELIIYGNFETLDKFLCSFLGAWTTNNFYERYLSHVEQKFKPNLVESVLITMALTRYGLREDELKDCLNISPLLWSQVYSIFAKYFSNRDGYIQIANADVYNGIVHKYESQKVKYQNGLISYLESRLIKVKEIDEKERIWDELASQYYSLAADSNYEDIMAEKLFHLISKPNVFWYFVMKRSSKLVAFEGEGKQIYKYWTWLYQFNPYKYSLKTYLSDDKFTDEDFLFKSSDIADVALHADDNCAIALIALKSVELYRKGTPIEENEITYFESNLSDLHLCANRWNMKELENRLANIAKKFSIDGTLPTEETIYEKILRLYAEAKSSNDIQEKTQKYTLASQHMSEIGINCYSDIAMINYALAQSLNENEMYDMALSHIDIAINNMNAINEEYDDYNECFKAHLQGYKGLILKCLGKLNEAYDIVYDAIIKYEDIEDKRIEEGDMRATITYVQYWEELLYEIQDLLDEK